MRRPRSRDSNGLLSCVWCPGSVAIRYRRRYVCEPCTGPSGLGLRSQGSSLRHCCRRAPLTLWRLRPQQAMARRRGASLGRATILGTPTRTGLIGSGAVAIHHYGTLYATLGTVGRAARVAGRASASSWAHVQYAFGRLDCARGGRRLLSRAPAATRSGRWMTARGTGTLVQRAPIARCVRLPWRFPRRRMLGCLGKAGLPLRGPRHPRLRVPLFHRLRGL